MATTGAKGINERVDTLKRGAAPCPARRGGDAPTNMIPSGVAFLGATSWLEPIVGSAPCAASLVFEDPEGWLSEKPSYWADLAQAAPAAPDAWMARRISAAAQRMRELLAWRSEEPADDGITEAEWTRLADSALFKLSRGAALCGAPSEAGDKERILAAETGVPMSQDPAHLQAHAGYLRSWVKAIRSDPMAIFTAAKAADRIQGYMLAMEREWAAAGKHADWVADYDAGLAR